MILMFYLKRYKQLVWLYKITKAPILQLSMQHLTTCGASEQQSDSCSLLDWPSGWCLHSNNTVNIVYTGESETKAMFCTFTFFRCEVQNVLPFQLLNASQVFRPQIHLPEGELNVWKSLYLVALSNHKETGGFKETT